MNSWSRKVLDYNKESFLRNYYLIFNIMFTGATNPAVITGVRLLLYQYFALLVKRFHYTKRNPKAFFVQNILPLFVIGGCLGIAHSVLNVYDPPHLLLHPSMYFKFSQYNYMFSAQNDSASSHDFDNTLYRACGVGAKYTGDSNNPDSVCYGAGNSPDTCSGYSSSTNAECSCKVCSRANISDVAPACFNGTVVSLLLIQ